MTDQEAENLLQELERVFGQNIPHPLYNPIQFGYYLKLYDFLKSIENRNQ